MKKVFLLISLALVLGLVMGCPQPTDSGNGSGSGSPLTNEQGQTLMKAALKEGTLTVTPIYQGEADGRSLKLAINDEVTDSNRGSIVTITIVKPADGSKIIPETDLSSLFKTYTALKTINGLEHVDTSSVTTMNSMFSTCLLLTSVDLSGFNTEKVTDMGSMFATCDDLNYLNLSSFNTQGVLISNSMFLRTTFIEARVSSNVTESISRQILPAEGESINGVYYDNPGKWVKDGVEYDTIPIVGGKADPGMYTAKTGIPLTKVKASLSDSILTITPSSEADATTFKLAINEVVNDGNRNSITAITIVEPTDNSKIIPETDLSSLFSYNGLPQLAYRSLETINGLEYLDTSAVTDMQSMFSNCRSLTSVNLSNFNTKNVIGISYMFAGCTSLTNLDLSSFNTEKVRSETDMFRDVFLTQIKVGNNLTQNISEQITPKTGDDNGIIYADPGKWVKDAVEYDTIPVVDGKAVAGTYTAKLAE